MKTIAKSNNYIPFIIFVLCIIIGYGIYQKYYINHLNKYVENFINNKISK